MANIPSPPPMPGGPLPPPPPAAYSAGQATAPSRPLPPAPPPAAPQQEMRAEPEYLPVADQDDWGPGTNLFLPEDDAPGTSLAAPPQVDFENMTFEQIAKAQGIEGLDFNQYGVLPICSLNHGQFRLSDGTSLGTEFVCVIQEAKPKFLYKTAVMDNHPDHQVVYTYDHQTTNGKPLVDVLAAWKAKGMSHDIKNYIEATCVMPDGRIILLSIPQTSISRLTNHVITVTVSKRLLSQVKTRVFIAPEVTRAVKPFNPIGFEVYNGR